jgi:hypothetical protein
VSGGKTPVKVNAERGRQAMLQALYTKIARDRNA